MILYNDFFQKDVVMLAKSLIGKVLCRKMDNFILKARIIETEAYSKLEPASHSSLGYSVKRAAMFMEAGTIYMYHSRAGASFNISAIGEGDAVLVKSGICFLDNNRDTIAFMQSETVLKKYKFGFEPWGLFLFIIIMIPNFFWFIFPPREDILRTDSATKTIDVIGSVFQVLMIATLCTLKNKESKKIRLTPCIIITAVCYLLYITGWIFYYCGITGKSIMQENG